MRNTMELPCCENSKGQRTDALHTTQPETPDASKLFVLVQIAAFVVSDLQEIRRSIMLFSWEMWGRSQALGVQLKRLGFQMCALISFPHFCRKDASISWVEKDQKSRQVAYIFSW